MKTKEIIRYIGSKGNFVTPVEIIENSLFFYVSAIVGILKPEIYYDDKLISLNHLALSLAGSSSGKTFTMKEVIRMFNLDHIKWCNLLKKKYKANQPTAILVNEIPLEEYLPKNDPFISLQGTYEGIQTKSLALYKAGFGSLNIFTDELLDVILSSSIDTIKQLSDGELQGKVIKSEVSENLTNLTCNMNLMGSSLQLKKDKKIYIKFKQSLGTGLYRRSFIFYSEPQKIVKNKAKHIDAPDVSFLYDFIKKHKDDPQSFIFQLDDDAQSLLELIKDELFEFTNNNIDDDFFSAELGSLDKIIKLSSIIAIIEEKEYIGIEELKYAYEFYLRLRESIKKLFNIEPQHMRIFKIIKKYKGITQSEILEKEMFDSKTFLKDLELVEELAYRSNLMLKVTGSKLKTYSLEPLPNNDINKMIVSYSNDGKLEKSINFKNVTIPFKNNDQSLEKMVVSDRVDSFCLVHFNGTRLDANVIAEFNCIGIDVDNGMSLDEAKEILKGWMYIIYTTRNHQKDKNGLVCDRFRILLPTKNIFSCTKDQYPEMISNVCYALNILSFDSSTRNWSRLWFTNKDGILISESGDLFDVIPHIPDTEVSNKIKEQKNQIPIPPDDDDEVGRRKYGFEKWFLSSTYEGARNANLFKACKFYQDLGLDIKTNVKELNSKLSEPLSTRELNTIIKSASK